MEFSLKASKGKVEKLLAGYGLEKVSVDDLMLFHEWAQAKREYPDREWCISEHLRL